MSRQKILVPYNFTPYDRKALDFLIRTFAGSDEAEITLYHGFTAVPQIDMRDSPVMNKITTNLNYLSGKLIGLEDELKQAKTYLSENGFSEKQVILIFQSRKKDTASEIIQLARNHHFDLIVINHKPGKATRFFTGSVYAKIVNALTNTTVCIVS